MFIETNKVNTAADIEKNKENKLKKDFVSNGYLMH